jgi:hypothetical protein
MKAHQLPIHLLKPRTFRCAWSRRRAPDRDGNREINFAYNG